MSGTAGIPVVHDREDVNPPDYDVPVAGAGPASLSTAECWWSSGGPVSRRFLVRPG
jgi:hypothetical protein